MRLNWREDELSVVGVAVGDEAFEAVKEPAFGSGVMVTGLDGRDKFISLRISRRDESLSESDFSAIASSDCEFSLSSDSEFTPSSPSTAADISFSSVSSGVAEVEALGDVNQSSTTLRIESGCCNESALGRLSTFRFKIVIGIF